MHAAPYRFIIHTATFACGKLVNPADLPKVLALNGKELGGYACRIELAKPKHPPLTEVIYILDLLLGMFLEKM